MSLSPTLHCPLTTAWLASSFRKHRRRRRGSFLSRYYSMQVMPAPLGASCGEGLRVGHSTHGPGTWALADDSLMLPPRSGPCSTNSRVIFSQYTGRVALCTSEHWIPGPLPCMKNFSKACACAHNDCRSPNLNLCSQEHAEIKSPDPYQC